MGKKASGFITLHRQIMEWEWYRHPHTAFLFIHLLLSANFTEGRFKGVPVKRGQLVTSIPQLSTDTGLSIQTTKTALSHLRLTGEITDVANRQYRIITVVKYDDYQKLTDKPSNDQPTTNRQTHQRLTDGRSNDQPQYNNNNNNNKKTNNKETIIPPTGDAGFEDFWAEYPRKVDKQNALKAWKKISPDWELVARIIDSVRRWKTSYQWTKENGQYIPYPATWLNGKRWEDDVPDKKQARSGTAPVKTVIAQDYEQRDYDSIQAEIDRRQAERVMARLRERGEA